MARWIIWLGFLVGLLIGRGDSPVRCAGARTCGEMLTCEQAYVCLAEGNTRLDRDRDGIPCESLCKVAD